MEEENQHLLPIGYELQEFVIQKHLGQGGFGVTYLAMDESFNRLVVLKEFLPAGIAVRQQGNTVVPVSNSASADYTWGLERFLQEARTLAKFMHKNIVTVRRVFPANGTAYMVMDYLASGSLEERLEKKRLTENEFRPILDQIVDGLKVVHTQSYLHRDIAPDNIMFAEDGTPVLIDFGAARMAIGGKSKPLSAIVKEGYAPLEQYNDKSPQGPYTDIYALSAVCYEVITGARPPESTVRIDADIDPIKILVDQGYAGWSRSFLRAVDAGLLIRRQDRPQTLDDWLSMIEGVTGQVNEHDDKLIQMIKNVWADGEITAEDRKNLYLAAEAFGRDAVWVDQGIRHYEPSQDEKTAAVKKNAAAKNSWKMIAGALVLAAGLFFAYDMYQANQKAQELEKSAYNQAVSRGTESGYQQYLREFPKGENRSAAQGKYDFLVKDRQAFDVAKQRHSESAYSKYLRENSSGHYKKQAQNALVILQTGRLDKEAYNRAISTKTLAGYQKYLRDFPSGNYRTTIQSKYNVLNLNVRDQQAYYQAKLSHTEASYDKYLRGYSKGKYRTEASKYRNRIRNDKQTRRRYATKSNTTDEYKQYLAANSVEKYRAFLARYPRSKYSETAAYHLAVKYKNGSGVTKSYTSALYWYKKSAEKGDVKAMNSVGIAYDGGNGVAKNKAVAFDWFLRGAEGEYNVSQFNVGLYYQQGNGVAKDYKMAMKWFEKAAKNGYARAFHQIGQLHEYGYGVSKSASNAIGWYKQSGDKGYAEAYNRIGEMYKRGLGVGKNLTTAESWFKKARDKGYKK